MIAFLLFVISAVIAVKPSCTLANLLTTADVPDSRYCPFVWATGLTTPRGIAIANNNDLLVIEQGKNQITALWDANGDLTSDTSERVVLAQYSGLNHGIVIDDKAGYVYASTPTDVYRWNYQAGDRKNLGAPIHVITNIPCCHHVTRTLQISPDYVYLYVQSGSGANVDPDPSHSQIRRFKIASFSSSGTVDWNVGEIVGNGLRNEVGMRFDPTGNLWGVENGVDDLYREDLGGDIHNTNPCEELNLFNTATNNIGQFYGYPYCWSEGVLAVPPGKGTGTQWLQPDFQGQGVWTDAWCQDAANVVVPKYCFPAHNAPLDIIFGNLTDASAYKMTAYVSFHGSWDKTPPDGYNVRQVVWDSNMNINATDLLKYQGPGATGPGWIRPVSLGFIKTPLGKTLMISSDSTYQIIGLAYN